MSNDCIAKDTCTAAGVSWVFGLYGDERTKEDDEQIPGAMLEAFGGLSPLNVGQNGSGTLVTVITVARRSAT